ncbi:hypothetical protein GCM10020360_14060 [Nonlabens tegetincola]
MLAGIALVAAPVAAAQAAPLAQATDGGTTATSCLPAGGGIGTGTPHPVDGQANVYVGGNFHMRAGAELEGLLVVEGDAQFDTPAPDVNRVYNLGVVGVGSLLTPPAMSDMLLVGGDLTVQAERELHVGHAIGGAVRVGGSISAADNAIQTSGGAVESGIGAAAAIGERAALGSVLSEQSARYGAMPATGTASTEWGTLTLTGDGTKNRQVFTLDGATVGSAKSLAYENIDPASSVIVNVTGPSAEFALTSVLSSKGGVLGMNSEFTDVAQRLLWNFPDASAVTIGSTAQFPGTVLVANPASTTTVQVPGTNGRMWVAGDLIHNLAGAEFHALPFLDDEVFGCDPTPTDPTPTDPTPTDPTDEERTLVAPTVTQAVCNADGTVTAPQLTLPQGSGLRYTTAGTVAAGAQVTVTAASIDDTKIAALAGWTLASDRLSATFVVTFNTVDCGQPGNPEGPDESEEPETPDTQVAPVAPTVTQAACTAAGSASAPRVELAETAGIDYSIAGTIAAGNKVTVTATAKQGFTLMPAEGWESTDAGMRMTVTLTAASCTTLPEKPAPETTPTPTHTPATPAALANSGAGSLPAIGLGAAALLALGALALFGARARRSRNTAE